MKVCPSCQAQLIDEITLCPRCGAVVQPVTPPQTPPGPSPEAAYQPSAAYPVYVDPADHTGEFTPEDIAANKLFAMLPYLFSVLGVVVTLLGAKESGYAQFHVRQALKIQICTVIVGLLTALSFWLVIPAIVGGVCICILEVLNIVAFFQVCSGKAKEPAMVRSLKFLQ